MNKKKAVRLGQPFLDACYLSLNKRYVSENVT